MKKKKSWEELSPGQKVASIVVGIIQIGLLFAALWDIARRPKDEFRGHKLLWTGIVFINFIGPIAYFLFGRVPESELLSPLPEDTN